MNNISLRNKISIQMRRAYRRSIPKPVRKVVNAGYRAAQKYIPKGSAKRLGSAMGQAMGSSVAGSTGAAVGSEIGRRLGKQFAQITGVGDYYLHDGTRIGSPFTSKTPTLRSSVNNNSTIISRSEYITDIYSGEGNPATAFKNQKFDINAGLSIADGGVFSWLPQIASGYQQYRFKQLIFEYRSTSGQAISGTNSALGSIIMSANYDSTLEPYTTKNEALNSQWAVSGGTDKSILFPIECRPRESKERWYDVRGQPIKPNQNIAIYDLANLQVASVGLQEENQNLGELWVSYTVELTKFRSNVNYTYTAHWSNTALNGGTVINVDYPLGTEINPLRRGQNDNLNMSIRTVPGTPPNQYWVFPPQIPIGSQFFIVGQYYGGGTDPIKFEINESQDIQLQCFNGNNASGVIFGEQPKGGVRVWFVTVTGPNPEVVIFGWNPGNNNNTDILCDWYFIEASQDSCLGGYTDNQRVLPAP